MAIDQSPTDTVRPRSSSTTVGEVMQPALTTVEAHGHLAAAAYLMRHAHASALVVTSDDEDRRPIAVLTATDIAEAVADGRDPDNTRMDYLWSRHPVTVTPGESVEAAARTMLGHRIRHLPVVDAGRTVGIIDMTDVCRALLAQTDVAS